MSWEYPGLLPIWEAQLGDFFNGSQVIIDTFVTTAKTKWLKQSALVMLLPHGLDGTGPEHSSARIERMLQLTNDPYDYYENAVDVNMHIANPTTPAQYFHLLRRQLKRNHRKPLVIASPKGLLRSPASTSNLVDMDKGTKFEPVLIDPWGPSADTRKILIVSGKIYFDLIKDIQANDLHAKIRVIRLEEICPFPFKALASTLRDVVQSSWADQNDAVIQYVQEEPRNQGAYGYVAQRINPVFGALGWANAKMEYVGRRESEVPAVGAAVLHARDKARFMEEALRI